MSCAIFFKPTCLDINYLCDNFINRNRRPLDMSGCNYFGVEKILSQARVKLEEGTILIVPISNM